jgi:hypothetical protein
MMGARNERPLRQNHQGRPARHCAGPTPLKNWFARLAFEETARQIFDEIIREACPMSRSTLWSEARPVGRERWTLSKAEHFFL